MRITNNMMLRHASTNINGNKVNVDSLNTQMTSQKKIQRPSEDPVVAIRALRLRSSVSELTQYYENNIEDAEMWLETTETSMDNIIKVLGDVRNECEYGSTGTLTTDDRNSILSDLKELRDQIYAEGNTDYATRTVFTGYRTNQTLTFLSDDSNTQYDITQDFTYKDISEHRYYSGDVTVPEGVAANALIDPDTDPTVQKFDRIRLAYGLDTAASGITMTNAAGTTQFVSTDGVSGTMSYQYEDATQTPPTQTVNFAVTVYDSLTTAKAATANGTLSVPDAGAIFIKESGELILGDSLSADLKAKQASLRIDYTKQGFDEGEVKPEYYFNCKKTMDSTGTPTDVNYEKYDSDGNQIYQDIKYLVAANQTLVVNTEASQVLSTDIGRDVDEMIEAMSRAVAADQKVTDIKTMMGQEAYSGSDAQEKLSAWLETAEKELAYADDNVQKMYNTYIGNFDGYLEKANLAQTDLGSRDASLALTKNRVSNQLSTAKELQSQNEDRDLSDIILDYTSAYTAYQASLQAAATLNETSLLSYL